MDNNNASKAVARTVLTRLRLIINHESESAKLRFGQFSELYEGHRQAYAHTVELIEAIVEELSKPGDIE